MYFVYKLKSIFEYFLLLHLPSLHKLEKKTCRGRLLTEMPYIYPCLHYLPVDISGAEVGKVAELGGEDPLVVVRIR